MSAPTARAAASSFDADGPEAFRSGTLNLKMDAISEHVSLVGAETLLLESLARAKRSSAVVSDPLYRRTTIMRDDEPLFQPHAKGDGAAQVRSLGDAAPGGRGVGRRLEGVHAMKGSREERHSLTTAAWDEERDSLCEEARERVARAVGAFRERMQRSDDAMASRTSVYDDDDALMRVEEDEVRSVWDEIANASIPTRSSWIDALVAEIDVAEKEVKEKLRESMTYVIDALVAVAHKTRGEIERYAADETSALNKQSIEDRRGVAELVKRLRTREVEMEKREFARWEEGLEKWRRVRTGTASRSTRR